MRRRRLQPTHPTPANKLNIERVTRVLVPVVRLGLRALAPLRWRGAENLPQGPALLLSNHVSLLDPCFIIAAGNRPVHFLATAAAMDDPIMGRVLQIWGSVPKKKFTVDAGAIRTLKHWLDLGAMVGSFPEGERSWDGRLLPLLPGIESLVRLLRAPVVPVRIFNADRVLPRWAEVRRYGPVTVEFGPARSFERKAPPALIREWLERELRVDPDDEAARASVRGRELALGLENPLFRCPQCFAWDALLPSHDEIRCRMCAASWRVDTHNCLIAVAGRGHVRSMTIVEARAAIRERNLQCFVTDERRFEREGTIATSEPMRLLDESGDEPALLGLGRMQLRADCLRVLDRFGSALLELPLAELATAEVELRRRLLFRSKDNRVFEAVLPHESPLKWAELVEHWRRRAAAPTSQQAAQRCADERD